ncbi:MAG: hypothetical protein RMY64_08840 [Nostoc sp. DedQUE08]|uniref:hypothetical protein n=1 Tax=Nostoc sp. DedQUE08 TaxID=3075393 RepID=UPI002AD2A89E|nr:hypothetical protein [Nostoc sp. DedQUE08]MDZ8065734.1 hypothetical protein [Nostoc sp. DedQUE08]
MSVDYLESDRASGSLGIIKLAITDSNLSNPANYCVGTAQPRHRIPIVQVFQCL